MHSRGWKAEAGVATQDIRVQANEYAGVWGELNAEAPVEQLLEIWSEGLGGPEGGESTSASISTQLLGRHPSVGTFLRK